MKIWEVRSYQSGTYIVTRDNGNPHYQVYADEKMEVCNQLQMFLNTNIRPSWLKELKFYQETKEACIGPNAIYISATGPMFLPQDDNGELNWQIDMSIKMVNKRKNMIKKLLRGA